MASQPKFTLSVRAKSLQSYLTLCISPMDRKGPYDPAKLL